MKLIKPSVKIVDQGRGIDGVYKHIELAGRVCYKSEDKIEEGTAEKMVEMLKKMGHNSPLEHGTVYLIIPTIKSSSSFYRGNWVEDQYIRNPYTRVNTDSKYFYITTNYRVIYENGWEEDLRYLCEPTEHHVKRITAHFVCDRGVMAELTRHRAFSFAIESTRQWRLR